jgi:uncharacterized protein YjiS (DUF1127 family)
MLMKTTGFANATPTLRLRTFVLEFVMNWLERRRQLHALADLDSHLLKDIGVSHEARVREISKPFWRR